MSATTPLPIPVPDLPEQLGEHDCPICFEPDTIREREPVCPNGHRICADCQPHIQSVYVRGGAACPLCRAPIPFIPEERVGGRPLAPAQPPRRVVDHTQRQERRDRANAAFNNLPARREAQQVFLQNRREGTIPANARFGGFHQRRCPCGRSGGSQGVRFLKLRDNTRRYRCEACYAQEMDGAEAPPPPAWNLPAVAAHDDVPL